MEVELNAYFYTILLDTSVTLDHLNGRAGRTQHLTHLLDQGHLLACCP